MIEFPQQFTKTNDLKHSRDQLKIRASISIIDDNRNDCRRFLPAFQALPKSPQDGRQ